MRPRGCFFLATGFHETLEMWLYPSFPKGVST